MATALDPVPNAADVLNRLSRPVGQKAEAKKKKLRVLTPDQLEFYDREGYVVVPNCVSEGELRAYRDRFDEVVKGINIPVEMEVARDVTSVGRPIKDEKDVLRLQDVHTDPVFFSYAENSKILDVVDDLIGTPDGNLMAMQLMFINKPPDRGERTSRQPMHQDTPYFPIRPLEHMCCAWTAVDKMSVQNGCLAVEPRSHKLPTHEHDFPDWPGVNRNYFGAKNYDPDRRPRLHFELNPGDTVFFHMNILHGSGVNRSAGCRKAITCHFSNGAVCKYIRPEDESQRRVAAAILGATKRRCERLGLPYDLKDLPDYFRRKTRLVRPLRAHL